MCSQADRIAPTVQYETIAGLSAINVSRTGPPGLISTVFEPYLSIFVDAQDK
jgi:hypothetical protein